MLEGAGLDLLQELPASKQMKSNADATDYSYRCGDELPADEVAEPEAPRASHVLWPATTKGQPRTTSKGQSTHWFSILSSSFTTLPSNAEIK